MCKYVKKNSKLSLKMAQSRKLIPEFSGVSLGNTLVKESDVQHFQGDVYGPSSSTANAITRYSGTGGKTVKDSGVTLSDSNVLASTGSLGLTASTSLTISAASLALPRSTVTQATSSTTGVTINSVSGQITTVALTTAADTTNTFTVTNSAVSAASTIVCTLLYSGTFGSGGLPVVSVSNVTSGAFDVRITNVHASNALSGFCKIHFIVA